MLQTGKWLMHSTGNLAADCFMGSVCVRFLARVNPGVRDWTMTYYKEQCAPSPTAI